MDGVSALGNVQGEARVWLLCLTLPLLLCFCLSFFLQLYLCSSSVFPDALILLVIEALRGSLERKMGGTALVDGLRRSFSALLDLHVLVSARKHLSLSVEPHIDGKEDVFRYLRF